MTFFNWRSVRQPDTGKTRLSLAPNQAAMHMDAMLLLCTSMHRIRSIQNDQQAIRDSSVIFVASYWRYPISCLKVHLAPLAQGADSEK